MFWLFARIFVLCCLAFLAGAVLTWLPLRATIRNLRAELSRPVVRPALTASAVVVPQVEEPREAVPQTGELPVAPVRPAVVESVVEVKGSPKSMIFHTPDSPYFKRMKGDVTFRSVAEAEQAGYTQWRPKSAAAVPAG